MQDLDDFIDGDISDACVLRFGAQTTVATITCFYGVCTTTVPRGLLPVYTRSGTRMTRAYGLTSRASPIACTEAAPRFLPSRARRPSHPRPWGSKTAPCRTRPGLGTARNAMAGHGRRQAYQCGFVFFFVAAFLMMESRCSNIYTRIMYRLYECMAFINSFHSAYTHNNFSLVFFLYFGECFLSGQR